jgi:hypothetical protein
MECHASTKENKIISFMIALMEMKIMLSVVRQREKGKCWIILLTCEI